MKHPIQLRTLALIAVLAPLAALFVYVAFRSGPLAPVPITLARVESKPISPALFGIGTVEAQYTFKIGPTIPGRLERLDVEVGDYVSAGQVLGTMDLVDLDARMGAQAATEERAKTLLAEAETRLAYARTQSRRYDQLYESRSTSEEITTTKRQELQIAELGVKAAREELQRNRAERAALEAQRANLALIAPADGLVVARHIDPGTTVVAGQSVVDMIDPESLWVNVRFDQIHAAGIAVDLPAEIRLRSRGNSTHPGKVIRTELLADPVTEETLAKVAVYELTDPLLPIGELAEVTVALPTLPEGPVIPNAAIHRRNGNPGVWQVTDGMLHFTPVRLGASDLNGHVQVCEGLQAGDQIVVYSQKELRSRSRIKVVEQLPGVAS